jgi:hypothetical protein
MDPSPKVLAATRDKPKTDKLRCGLDLRGEEDVRRQPLMRLDAEVLAWAFRRHGSREQFAPSYRNRPSLPTARTERLRSGRPGRCPSCLLRRAGPWFRLAAGALNDPSSRMGLSASRQSTQSEGPDSRSWRRRPAAPFRRSRKSRLAHRTRRVPAGSGRGQSPHRREQTRSVERRETLGAMRSTHKARPSKRRSGICRRSPK